ncbi:RICIN domain-containing protein [Acrocarpospora catenulata]|uniref:RICIN domain-containing protein n=1 Tax=Acrocarpospora catenulata TaxID=2836182 RepID=UPI001BD9B893|nr:RICIN domain-containing protein [Acrocarpospora catenulata]
MKRLISSVTVVVVAIFAAATPASAAEIKYELRPLNSGKCLDVVNGSRANGARIQQWTCSGNSQQKWYIRSTGHPSGELYTIVSAHSGACLDLRDSNPGNGAVVQQWTCSGGYNQQWWLTWDATMGAYRIKAGVGDRCLDVTGASTANGAYMQTWDCFAPGTRNQRFRLVA